GLLPRPRAERSEPDFANFGMTLPFVREERASGPLFRRHQLLAPSHHVGRMPVDAAANSRAELLGLLALDPRVSAADPRRALYFDTETTGLGGGAGVLAFLVGLAWFDDELRLNSEQLLLRSPAEEAPLLEAFAERLEACDLLVSYNGKSFDLPLLNGRMVMNRRPKLPERAHLDLLHVARRLHKARLGACRLISLESEVLGFVRGPDIAGVDIAPRYAHYLRTGDDSALEQVIEHNAWDVVSMAALVGLYGEPFEMLHERDLLGLARTLKRARAFDEAERAATVALERGAGPEAHRAHGEIAKARGDRAQALAHFEAFAAEVDDPAVRLELAKLYEHHVRAPISALGWVEQGTSEDSEQAERRRARLAEKISKAAKNVRKPPA
ncbi:MAG TPA: ribonuclease H-like domain-containing protein, partial [Polyangiaceae bacterium]